LYKREIKKTKLYELVYLLYNCALIVRHNLAITEWNGVGLFVYDTN